MHMTTKALASLLCSVFFSMSAASVDCQVSETTQNIQTDRPNLWRKQAVSVKIQADNVDSHLRGARDAYWNYVFPPNTGREGIAYSTGAAPAQASPVSELGPAPLDYPWIIGRFESFHVFQTSGGGGIYTEVNMRVIYSFPGTKTTVYAGDLLDIGLPGGTVIDSTGKTRSFLIADLPVLVEPAHEYLIQLVPCAAVSSCASGAFYALGNRWDLTNGIALPVTPAQIRVWHEGRSKISGSQGSTLITRFTTFLSELQEDKRQ